MSQIERLTDDVERPLEQLILVSLLLDRQLMPKLDLLPALEVDRLPYELAPLLKSPIEHEVALNADSYLLL